MPLRPPAALGRSNRNALIVGELLEPALRLELRTC